jgi:hypothetical protein
MVFVWFLIHLKRFRSVSPHLHTCVKFVAYFTTFSWSFKIHHDSFYFGTLCTSRFCNCSRNKSSLKVNYSQLSPPFLAIISLTETCTTLSHHRVTIEKSLKMIFVSDSEHEMPGHLDSDLYCQQWVRLSMLWEDLVSNFHIISEAIYSPIIVSLFSMGFCLYCHQFIIVQRRLPHQTQIGHYQGRFVAPTRKRQSR